MGLVVAVLVVVMMMVSAVKGRRGNRDYVTFTTPTPRPYTQQAYIRALQEAEKVTSFRSMNLPSQHHKSIYFLHQPSTKLFLMNRVRSSSQL